MIHLEKWIHRLKRKRTIDVTTSGKWFLTLTILFGLAAVLSNNNVLYLLECLLLGFLVLSGALSDRMLWNLSTQWREQPAHAGRPHQDQIVIFNSSRLPALSIEVGEWTRNGFELRGYLPYLRAKSSALVPVAGKPYSRRGRHAWTGRVMATSFPFGFARKLRWIAPDGERWIRPALPRENPMDFEESSGTSNGTADYEEGSLRPFQIGDDFRDVAWSYSHKIAGPHQQRVRVNTPQTLQIRLEAHTLKGSLLERHLSSLATQLVWAENQGAPIEFEIGPNPQNIEPILRDAEAGLEFLARYPAKP